jgi:hypothetical protein
MKPKMIEIRSCGQTFEMSVRDLTDWQLDRLLEQSADRAAIDPAEIDPLRKEQVWRREAASEHTFTDTNRHLVEVPDSFAVARWSRNADVVTICRCILGTLKYEPHAVDTAVLRRALEGVIEGARVR